MEIAGPNKWGFFNADLSSTGIDRHLGVGVGEKSRYIHFTLMQSTHFERAFERIKLGVVP